jgi:hypothetical protein
LERFPSGIPESGTAPKRVGTLWSEKGIFLTEGEVVPEVRCGFGDKNCKSSAIPG